MLERHPSRLLIAAIAVAAAGAHHAVAAISASELTELRLRLQLYFDTPPPQRSDRMIPGKFDRLLRTDGGQIRAIVWETYRRSRLHETRRGAHDRRVVTHEELSLTYALRRVGREPQGGYPLFISLPSDERLDGDDQALPIATEKSFIHVVVQPRDKGRGGPPDDALCPTVANLIRQLLLFEPIDADRVHLLGRGRGGDRAFIVGTQMADRFASVYAADAAPTDGASPAVNLRNTMFTGTIGDDAEARLRRCAAFDKAARRWRAGSADTYPVALRISRDPQRAQQLDPTAIAIMHAHRRTPAPKAVHWEQSGDAICDFNWLHAAEPGAGREIYAEWNGNALTLALRGVRTVGIHLDRRVIDMSSPVTVDVNGVRMPARGVTPRVATLCESLWRRGDPGLMFDATLTVDAP